MHNPYSDKLILVGGGGNASSLQETFKNYISGYLAPEESKNLISLKWYGNDSEAPSLIQQGWKFHIAFVYSGKVSMEKRKSLIEKYIDFGADFISLIAPTAIVTENTEIGKGSLIQNGAIINKSLLGDNTIINTGAIIEHDCYISNNTFIGPGAVIGGMVKIGKNCFIGLGAKIRNGIEISDGVTIGMGSIVTKNINTPGTYYGII